jgi:hypothetical protein
MDVPNHLPAGVNGIARLCKCWLEPNRGKDSFMFIIQGQVIEPKEYEGEITTVRVNIDNAYSDNSARSLENFISVLRRILGNSVNKIRYYEVEDLILNTNYSMKPIYYKFRTLKITINRDSVFHAIDERLEYQPNR